MKLTVLGCGTAFSTLNLNQQFLLEEDGERLLIDCGWTTPFALERAGLSPRDIDAIYISHAHADHIGGLEYMAFIRYDWVNRPEKYYQAKQPFAPKLIANEQLVRDLWEKSLRGGLESMEGFVADINTYFEPVPVHANEEFSWGAWKFQLIQQIHIMSNAMVSWTFGLMMGRSGRKTVYFTNDSQHCSPKQMEVFYRRADLIFQDCECTPFYSGVHANYEQLAGYDRANAIKLSADIKAKMWLSHYQDFVSQKKDFHGAPCDWDAKAKADGFRGFIKVGQVFEV